MTLAAPRLYSPARIARGNGAASGRFTFRVRPEAESTLTTDTGIGPDDASSLVAHHINNVTWAAENRRLNHDNPSEVAASKGMALASAEIAIAVMEPGIDKGELVRTARATVDRETSSAYLGYGNGYRSVGLNVEQRRDLVEHFVKRADDSASRAASASGPVADMYAAAAAVYRSASRSLAEPHVRDALIAAENGTPMAATVADIHRSAA